MDWSQRKVTHAARKPPNITHSVRIAVNTGGGKGQCYSKRKKRKKKRKKEGRKQKQPKIIKEEKKRRGWENCQKRFQTQITKYLNKKQKSGKKNRKRKEKYEQKKVCTAKGEVFSYVQWSCNRLRHFHYKWFYISASDWKKTKPLNWNT